jgi:hypothetical protein
MAVLTYDEHAERDKVDGVVRPPAGTMSVRIPVRMGMWAPVNVHG